mmetsp:Transcript_106211/g.298632  ORF Transcript_106211/g.298632 Transcript_106211/m.298632 type:complete len:624 (-) Transcript_106211:353-2224(-)
MCSRNAAGIVAALALTLASGVNPSLQRTVHVLEAVSAHRDVEASGRRKQTRAGRGPRRLLRRVEGQDAGRSASTALAPAFAIVEVASSDRGNSIFLQVGSSTSGNGSRSTSGDNATEAASTEGVRAPADPSHVDSSISWDGSEAFGGVDASGTWGAAVPGSVDMPAPPHEVALNDSFLNTTNHVRIAPELVPGWPAPRGAPPSGHTGASASDSSLVDAQSVEGANTTSHQLSLEEERDAATEAGNESARTRATRGDASSLGSHEGGEIAWASCVALLITLGCALAWAVTTRVISACRAPFCPELGRQRFSKHQPNVPVPHVQIFEPPRTKGEPQATGPRAMVEALSPCSSTRAMSELENIAGYKAGYDCAFSGPMRSRHALRLEAQVLDPGIADGLVAPLTKRRSVLYLAHVSRRVHHGIPAIPVAFASKSIDFQVALVDSPNVHIFVSGDQVRLFDMCEGSYACTQAFGDAPFHWQDLVLSHSCSVATGNRQASSALRADGDVLDFHECALLVGQIITLVGTLSCGPDGALSLECSQDAGKVSADPFAFEVRDSSHVREPWRTSWERPSRARAQCASLSKETCSLGSNTVASTARACLASDDPRLLRGAGIPRVTGKVHGNY